MLVPSTLAVIMATHGYNPPLLVPTGRLASSSSLPPELKTVLDGFRNKFWRFGAATIANMLSPSIIPPFTLVATAYSLLDQKLLDWSKDTEGSSFYGPFLDSLSDFFDASNRALNLSNPPIIDGVARWHAGLRFEQLTDGTCGIYSHEFGAKKREVVGGVRKMGQRLELAIPA